MRRRVKQDELVMKTPNNQQGVVLIVLILIICLSALAYFLRTVNTASLRFNKETNNQQILALAKEAIISHSVSRVSAGERPGEMPRPDYFAATEVPFDFNGASETGCTNAASVNGLPLVSASTVNMRCLGRLPWRTIGMPIPNSTENDVIGNMPWYAVSANLVDPTCLAVLNSSILNLLNNPPPAPLDCSGLTLPYPWLTVHDSNGNVLSNRVAVVLIIPNANTAAQTRPVLPLNGVANYLDSVNVPAGCSAPCVPGLYSNADFDNDFVVLDDKSIGTANDYLTYITIDDLMRHVERRAAQEAARQLNNYYLVSSGVPANRYFPYAAALGDINNSCQEGRLTGFLPVTPASAACASATSCTVTFPMTEVSFELQLLPPSNNYTSSSALCSRAANICTCTGAGSCIKSTAPASTFSCNTNGLCQSVGSNPEGLFSFSYTPKVPDVTDTSGTCSIVALGQVDCSGAGTFSSPSTSCTHPRPGLSNIPDWFTENRWNELMYYAITASCSSLNPGCVGANLVVGNKNNVHALIMSTGRPLPATEVIALAQVRPSVNIQDYLDSADNVGELLYESSIKSDTAVYNDQSFIVAPK